MKIIKVLSNEKVALLLIIIALGTVLRFYRIIPNLILNGEMGTDYMNVWDMIHGTRTWLIGPRTSHEWFFIPPLSYWVYAVLLYFGKYSPVIINLFWAFVGSFGILISYNYTKKLFNEKIAIITAFLISVSPEWIFYTRASRYNAPVAIMFFPYLYYLKKSIEDKGRSLGILGFILGLSMNFFPSPLLLLPAVIAGFLIYKVKPKFKYLFYFILGFAIPNLTFIIYEFSDKFAITRQIAAWVPYRIAGFFGLYHKNTVNNQIFSQNIYSIFHFFAMPLPIFLLILIGGIFLFIKALKAKDKEMSYILLIINLIVGYSGLFIHGNPPEHYYLVIFPIPIILTAYFLVKIFKNWFVIIGLTLTLGILGIWTLINTNWFYSTYFPNYNTQLKVADKIIADAKGSDFALIRYGVNDQFENYFENNYTYLLTIRGSRINNLSNLRYTIVEGGSTVELFRNNEILDPEIK